MFSDVDEVDVSSPKLAFVFGRRSEPVQPQIPRFRAVAKKAKTFVALLASEEQARCCTTSALCQGRMKQGADGSNPVRQLPARLIHSCWARNEPSIDMHLKRMQCTGQQQPQCNTKSEHHAYLCRL